MACKIAAVDAKIANIRCAIEDGLTDAGWANSRIRELTHELRGLQTKSDHPVEPPRIDTAALSGYTKDLR